MTFVTGFFTKYLFLKSNFFSKSIDQSKSADNSTCPAAQPKFIDRIDFYSFVYRPSSMQLKNAYRNIYLKANFVVVDFLHCLPAPSTSFHCHSKLTEIEQLLFSFVILEMCYGVICKLYVWHLFVRLWLTFLELLLFLLVLFFRTLEYILVQQHSCVVAADDGGFACLTVNYDTFHLV